MGHSERQEVGKLTVVCAYRPNPGGPSSGSTTVWSQQRQKFVEAATARKDTCTIDPREQCLKDLGIWLQEARDRGERVILLMDGNQALEEQTERYSLNHLMDDCDLVSAMNARHPGASVNSTKTGSETINHILIANRIKMLSPNVGNYPLTWVLTQTTEPCMPTCESPNSSNYAWKNQRREVTEGCALKMLSIRQNILNQCTNN